MAFSCFFKLLTWNVVIVSTVIIALGVANLTIQCSYTGGTTPGSTWVSQCYGWSGASGLFIQASSVFCLAVGIWGGLPCLISGIGALRVAKKPNPGKNWLWAFVTVSTLAVTPLTVLLSAFNAASVFSQIQSLVSYTIPVSYTQPPSGLTASFAVPLTTAILAGLVFLHLLAIHCKLTWFDEDTVTVVDVPVKVIPAPPPPMPEPVLRSTAWHAAGPGAGRCGCHHVYGH